MIDRPQHLHNPHLKFLPLWVFLFAALLAAIFFIYFNEAENSPEEFACTLEAKVCPDGSTVSRQGPDCEFAECPNADVVNIDPRTSSAQDYIQWLRKQHEPIGECDARECLFRIYESVVGVAWLSGYYDDETFACNVLVVAEGSSALIDDFIELVERGNTVNSLADDGSLLLNIDLSTLSDTERIIALGSTSNEPVRLNVFRRIPEGMGVTECYSFVEVLSIES